MMLYWALGLFTTLPIHLLIAGKCFLCSHVETVCANDLIVDLHMLAPVDSLLPNYHTLDYSTLLPLVPLASCPIYDILYSFSPCLLSLHKQPSSPFSVSSNAADWSFRWSHSMTCCTLSLSNAADVTLYDMLQHSSFFLSFLPTLMPLSPTCILLLNYPFPCSSLLYLLFPSSLNQGTLFSFLLVLYHGLFPFFLLSLFFFFFISLLAFSHYPRFKFSLSLFHPQPLLFFLSHFLSLQLSLLSLVPLSLFLTFYSSSSLTTSIFLSLLPSVIGPKCTVHGQADSPVQPLVFMIRL